MFRFSIKNLLELSLLGLALAALPADPSPVASTDIICHTKNPAECYPRIFQPTEDFQVIHDDQHIPPGLHVRLNIYTGTKEARLNIPMEGEEIDPDLPTEQAVVVVPRTENEDESDERPALRDRVPQKPPAYEAAGKILPPIANDETITDSENFQRSLTVLGSSSTNLHENEENLNSALAVLVDLSHDIYYGVEIVKRQDILFSLVSLLSYSSSSPTVTSHQRRQAATILANAIQNNPTALKDAQATWTELLHDSCTSPSALTKVCSVDSLVSILYSSLSMETGSAAMKAKIYLLHGLTKSPELRNEFLKKNGLDLILSIFPKEGKEWDATRVKIAQFVTDTFLDEDMGAELGLFPTGKASDSRTCAKPENEHTEGCWDYHLDKMHGDEWKTEFARLLKKARVPFGGQEDYSDDREL
jgi:nucleotide exchange factor SIL1